MPGRYAIALCGLAVEREVVDQVKANLDRFDALVAVSDDLKRLVRSPKWTAERPGKLWRQCSTGSRSMGWRGTF
jgi:F-type H+-transporting ATPase subunit delta